MSEQKPAQAIMLTQAERDKFAAYLEQDARSDDQMGTQMEKLGGPMAIMAKRYKAKAAAKLVVAMELRSIEDMSVGGGGS